MVVPIAACPVAPKWFLPYIQPIHLPIPGLEQLQTEALSEGYHFLETLATEWASGENRFDTPGEILCGHLDQGVLVAVGGLNRDPFLADPNIGRLRRLYVRPAWRSKGIGTSLVNTLVAEARKSFEALRLRAESPRAALLYERLGFVPGGGDNATHVMRLTPGPIS